ncbi:COG1872 [hydrothermal vent metagenome]|uniref:COG1872 n=1 Tax=hydrothermal vent metagenome TaxID=652676 RepID=A0A3B1C2A1_9ZZZZ
MKPAIESIPDGVRLKVYVAPRASKTAVAGYYGEALKIRLAAPPVDGAANEALIAFIAKLFKTPKSGISIVGGIKSKRKVVEIEGVDLDRARTTLENISV